MRIDTEALATHIEVALACAPAQTVEGLSDRDAFRRRHASTSLARFLADRLGCFEVSATDLGDKRQMPLLSGEVQALETGPSDEQATM